MTTKIKGIYKGFKYITQIFVVKEREMEIGYPTDVKHVAHIGWDGPNGNGPSWMNEFKTAPDFSTSIGSLSERRNPNSMAVTTSGSNQVLALLISQIVLNVSAECICCIKSPRFPYSNWGVALISFLLSWGAIIALANSAFGIVYYLILTATAKNGPNPNLEGIAMGQP